MQIVGYTPTKGSTSDAALLFADASGTVTEQPLQQGTTLEYTLHERHCAGEITTNQTHNSCPQKETPHCYNHQDFWKCAICTGDCSKPLDTCDEPHAIYLAAFAPNLFKVGVTRQWRLKTRLTEQGALQAAHIFNVEDGRIARQKELQITIDYDIPDQIRTTNKLDSLNGTIDEHTWQELLENFDPIEEFSFDYNLDLSTPPLPEVLLTGTVIGTQGRILVLENTGTTYAIDLRDLLGYNITPEPDAVELQASFDSFG